MVASASKVGKSDGEISSSSKKKNKLASEASPTLNIMSELGDLDVSSRKRMKHSSKKGESSGVKPSSKSETFRKASARDAEGGEKSKGDKETSKKRRTRRKSIKSSVDTSPSGRKSKTSDVGGDALVTRKLFEVDSQNSEIQEFSADRAAKKELAKRSATVPKLPSSLLADIRNNPPEVFEAFEVQVHGVHPALWFQAFVGSMPSQLLTIHQLQKLRSEFPENEEKQYKALKALVLETYVNVNAHREARKKFEKLKMSKEYGVREFAQRIIAQRSICDALPKCDVNDDTQRDVFVRGLPSKLAERLLEKSKSSSADFDKLVSMADKIWRNMTAAGVNSSDSEIRGENFSLGEISTEFSAENTEFLSALSKNINGMSKQQQKKLQRLLFGKSNPKKRKRAREFPKYEGDQSKFILSLKSKYDPEIWKKRQELLDSGAKITKENDDLFELDKHDGKFVCVKCWKYRHTASRCTAGRKRSNSGANK